MRQLILVERSIDGYLAGLTCQPLPPGGRVVLRGWDALTPAVAEGLRAARPELLVETPDDPAAPPPPLADAGPEPLSVLFGATGEILSPLMASFLDRPAVTLVAPVTNHFHRNKVLFLVSIPKAGTHLLFELAQAMGFAEGGECPPMPKAKEWPGKWYYLEHSNSHTAAPDFLIDTVRRRPFGNRDHPFTRNPTLFIYRNPRDIVASEANYYHEDGKTAFFQYLAHLSHEERLLRLIDDPWLLGSIRDRIGKFIAWTDFSNVIPVSYEELVGPAGGGDRAVQLDLLWSLQLKLHVPGRPEDFAARIYNENSPTFRVGRIGAGRRRFTEEAERKFAGLPQDFMAALGYDDPDPASVFPTRAAEFRHRMPLYSRSRFFDQPILEKADVLGHNIVRFRHHYVAVPVGSGAFDLGTLDEGALAALPQSQDLTELEHRLFLASGTRNP